MDTTEERLDFTQDWFTQNIPVWEALMPTLQVRHKFLEVGSFEGRATCWMLEHGLDETGEMCCIDTWGGSTEMRVLPVGDIRESYNRFCRNVKASRGPNQRVRIFRNTSTTGLASLILTEQATFDFVYVDGGHAAPQVLGDAVMAWPLVKPGGLMVFDDYLWDLQYPPHTRPKFAIDTFLALFYDQLTTEAMGYQVAIRKKVD